MVLLTQVSKGKEKVKTATRDKLIIICVYHVPEKAVTAIVRVAPLGHVLIMEGVNTPFGARSRQIRVQLPAPGAQFRDLRLGRYKRYSGLGDLIGKMSPACAPHQT